MTESGRPHIHLITPGDHFSPGTGSAIPTVVHGLAAATPEGSRRPAVLVSRGTYPDRHTSAEVVEYAAWPGGGGGRVRDVSYGRLGLPRRGERRVLSAALAPLSERPDSVVLVHNAPEAIPLVPDRHRSVLYAHNQLFRTYGRREVGRVLAGAEHIVCVSNYLAERIAHHLPADLHGRLRVVHNGVDTGFFVGPRVPQEGSLRVTFLGRVVPEKGVHVLLEALQLLDRRDITLTVAGRPGFSATAALTHYERRLRKLAAALDPAPRFVSFLPRPEVPALLHATDVLVVPSVWPEPFGLTALEGMAAGAAVVATDVGGLSEAVGEAALLIPPGDARALASVVQTFAEEPLTLSRWQSAAGHHATRCDWSRVRETLGRTLGGCDDGP